MIRKLQLLYCDNEHGMGPVTFPPFDELSAHAIEQEIIKEVNTSELRRAAKQSGWGRVNGADYCPACMESM